MRRSTASSVLALACAALAGSAAPQPARGEVAPAPPTASIAGDAVALPCPAAAHAYLRARLDGELKLTLSWSGADLRCSGMPRPDGRGMRVTFASPLVGSGERLVFVFGIAQLAEGAQGKAVPVNLTVIREGRAFYGTRGDDKCMLDEVHQERLEDLHGQRQWRVEARGFCLEPARELTGKGRLLVSTFDFAGVVAFSPAG